MAGPVVRVAAVGDLHCTRTSQGAFQALFSRIAESAEVLLLAGDLTDYGLPEEARVLAQGTGDRTPAHRRGPREPRFRIGQAGRDPPDSDRRGRDGPRRRRLRAARHRHRRREGLRRRLRAARPRAVGRADHQAVRSRGRQRGAEARSGAGAAANRSPGRAPALRAGTGDGRRRAARNLSIRRIQPPRGADRPLPGVARRPRPRAPRPARGPHEIGRPGLQRLDAALDPVLPRSSAVPRL